MTYYISFSACAQEVLPDLFEIICNRNLSTTIRLLTQLREGQIDPRINYVPCQRLLDVLNRRRTLARLAHPENIASANVIYLENLLDFIIEMLAESQRNAMLTDVRGMSHHGWRLVSGLGDGVKGMLTLPLTFGKAIRHYDKTWASARDLVMTVYQSPVEVGWEAWGALTDDPAYVIGNLFVSFGMGWGLAGMAGSYSGVSAVSQHIIHNHTRMVLILSRVAKTSRDVHYFRTITGTTISIGNTALGMQEGIRQQRIECLSRMIESSLKAFTINYTYAYWMEHYIWQRAERHQLPRPKNLVFQGGGAKGLAYLGALIELEISGITLDSFERVGGTSAGAITALLIAVGYTVEELRDILSRLNFEDFMVDAPPARRRLFVLLARLKNDGLSIGSAQELIDLLIRQGHQTLGLFSGEALRLWLECCVVEKLAPYSSPEEAKLTTFEDLERLKRAGHPVKSLAVVGTNISTHAPQSEIFSALETPDMLIVDAVRISLSIPLIFYPHKRYIKYRNTRVLDPVHQDSYVDGGLFRNFPINIFDDRRYRELDGEMDGDDINWKTIGLKLEDDMLMQEAYLVGWRIPRRADAEIRVPREILPMLSLLTKLPYIGSILKDVIDCFPQILNGLNLPRLLAPLLIGNNQAFTPDEIRNNWYRSGSIYSGEITALDFNLTEDQKTQLIQYGRDGARAFLYRFL